MAPCGPPGSATVQLTFIFTFQCVNQINCAIRVTGQSNKRSADGDGTFDYRTFEYVSLPRIGEICKKKYPLQQESRIDSQITVPSLPASRPTR